MNYDWMPPCFERTKAKRHMCGLWRRKMRWMPLALMLMLCVWMLSGCAGPTSVVCSDPLMLPAQMSAPQSPGAKAYSEKASSYLEKVEKYFAETPQYTTQQ